MGCSGNLIVQGSLWLHQLKWWAITGQVEVAHSPAVAFSHPHVGRAGETLVPELQHYVTSSGGVICLFLNSLCLPSGPQVRQTPMGKRYQPVLAKASPSFGQDRRVCKGKRGTSFHPKFSLLDASHIHKIVVVTLDTQINCVFFVHKLHPHNLWRATITPESLLSWRQRSILETFISLSYRDHLSAGGGCWIGKILECHMPRKFLGGIWS